MARQDEMSFSEKHVEKGVLVLCLGLLLFSIWHWVLSSPRRVPLVDPNSDRRVAAVTPEEVDKTLERAAAAAKLKHTIKEPEPFTVPDIPETLKILRATPFKGGRMIPLGQPRTALLPFEITIDEEGTFGMLATVEAMEKVTPAPAAPVIGANWELVDTGPTPYDGPVHHGAVTYSLAELTKILESLLEPEEASPATTQPDKKPARLLKYINFRTHPLMLTGVDIEYQVGDDVNADWTSIEARPLQDTRLPIPMTIGGKVAAPLARLPLLPATCAPEDRKPVLIALNTLYNFQEDLWNPMYFSILDQTGLQWDSWYRNLPREPIEAAGGAVTETLRQIEAAAARPAAGAGGGVIRGRPPIGGGGGPQGGGRGGPQGDGGAGRSRRGAPPSRGGAIDPARGADIDAARDGGGRPPYRRTPRQPVRQPVRRPAGGDPIRDGGVGTGEPGGPAVVDTEITPPAFEAQMQTENYVIWFHNMNVVPGKAYRYRIRLKLLNPLFHNEGVLKKDKKRDFKVEASKTAVSTPWSEWSKPVRTARQMDFFLVNSKRIAINAKTGNATVAVFTKRLGQPVASRFTLVEGEPIGAIVPTLLKNPPSSIYSPPAPLPVGAPPRPTHSIYPVNFSIGGVIVDVNLAKRIFKAGRETKTAEILFIDELKRLRSRLQLPDPRRRQVDESPEWKRFEELEAQADAAARAATAATSGEAEREDYERR